MVKAVSSIDAMMEIEQSTIFAFASIRALITQGSKVSGFQMTSTNPSTINFKVAVPPGADVLPNAKIRIYAMTLEPSTNALVEYTVKTHATTTLGVINTAFTSEAASSKSVANAVESLQIHDIPILVATTYIAGQFVTGQLTRNTASSGDTAGNILIMKIQLLVDVDVQ